MQIDNLWCLGYAFAVCYASQGKQVMSILCCRLFVGLSCSWQVRGTLHLHLNHHQRIKLPRRVHCSENMLYQVLTCYDADKHKVYMLVFWICAEMHWLTKTCQSRVGHQIHIRVWCVCRLGPQHWTYAVRLGNGFCPNQLLCGHPILRQGETEPVYRMLMTIASTLRLP